MKIRKASNQSIEAVLEKLQELYPGAIMKKSLLGPKRITVPYSNFKFYIRDKRDHLAVDFNPPILWLIIAFVIGGGIVAGLYYGTDGRWPLTKLGVLAPIAVVVIITGVIFKVMNKQQLADFQNEVSAKINGNEVSSIGRSARV